MWGSDSSYVLKFKGHCFTYLEFESNISAGNKLHVVTLLKIWYVTTVLKGDIIYNNISFSFLL